jgi:uncharacterized protein YecE (DUF72 family)
MTATRVLAGIAGWSYPDWEGVVYPSACKDKLRFCAELVDVLEINSTFYRVPDARTSSTWATRIRDLPTLFTAKLPQEFTHRGRSDPQLVLTARDGFAPLQEVGKLQALLLQFSHSFACNEANLAHLRRLVDAFRDLAPLVVEVRHGSWNLAPSLVELERLGVSVSALDYPGTQGGFSGDATGIYGPCRLGYLRLHGRNVEAWFRRSAGRDQVYNHEYSPAELQEIQAKLTRLAASAELAIAIANNHFHGKGMKVALELLAWLRGGRVTVPPPLLQSYPGLASIAVVPPMQQRGLFDDRQ